MIPMNRAPVKRSLVAIAEAIVVDPTSGSGSNGNAVFEPGETVTIRPTWRNQTEAPIPLSASASNFTGPAGPDRHRIPGRGRCPIPP